MASLSYLAAQDEQRLSGLAHERLLGLILAGEVPVGSLLSERRIALRLGISRTPLRDAMRQLEAEGLLERLPDGRMRVRVLEASDYIDNLNARQLIEGETARLAAGRVPVAQIASFRSRLLGLLERRPGPEEMVWRLDDELHDAIAVAAGSDRLRAMLRDLRREAHLVDPRRLPDRILPGTQEHLVLLAAIETGDAAAAAAAMREHLEQVKTDFLALLARGGRAS
jgi:DNA-binding GntR family transcriptional regulator